MSDDRHTLRIANEDIRVKACEQCGTTFEKPKWIAWANWGRTRFCSRSCQGLARREANASRRLPINEAFAQHFQPGDGCWEWTWCKDQDGYGLFVYGSKTFRAHVYALKLDGRPVPKGMYGCHTCDNPSCVRPSHLYPGTPAQNSADAKARRRIKIGELSSAAKITGVDVAAIRASSAQYADLAERYGISVHNVYAIRSRKTWKHLP